MSARSQPKLGPVVARFGVFEVDLEARELRKNGVRLKLQDQPFAVLAVLIESAGGIVTREELRQKLWPADTFVDFDHSLNTAVNKIRETLGDSATSPRFVETLARRGYRFLAAVSWDSPVQSESEAAPDKNTGTDDGLPAPHRGISRGLFGLLQIMYLVFYVEALLHWRDIDRLSWTEIDGSWILAAVIVTAGVGIPTRCYLLSAVAFDYRKLGENFERIFLGVLLIDELWAIAPFLLVNKIGFGPAFGATAALLYVPFAERTLLRMAYPQRSGSRP